MTKYAINDQILFDYGVTKAKATEDAARSFRKRVHSEVRKAFRVSDGEPPWLRKPCVGRKCG